MNNGSMHRRPAPTPAGASLATPADTGTATGNAHAHQDCTRGCQCACDTHPAPQQVPTRLTARDRLGALRVRLGIGRMTFRVKPGLHRIGHPTPDSPVFVTANYKLSFDHLRSNLDGFDGWILVLDTQGVNVWCAAGKGTFGTEELVRRIAAEHLDAVVSHRKLIVPQLGAPGVAAHAVRRQTGFTIVYGPVRAADLPDFLRNGCQATAAMRCVNFTLQDRMVLVPVELVQWTPWLLGSLAVLGLIAGFSPAGFSLQAVRAAAPLVLTLSLSAYAAGLILFPALLPWLPGRAFSLKGAVAGIVAWNICAAMGIPFRGFLEALAWLLFSACASASLALQFTGSTPFTSESGVRREMRVAMPILIAAGLAGIVLYVASRLWI